MIAFPALSDIPMDRCCCGNSVRVIEKPTLPDLSVCNRQERRTLEAIAKKYGWAIVKGKSEFVI